MATAKTTRSTVLTKWKKPILTNKVIKCYLAGSMEGRKYEDLKYEHYYVCSQLRTLSIDVFDPLLKEDHKPGKLVGIKSCGMTAKDVNHQDLTAVENDDIVFWVTGDIQSEGSVTEIAWAGAMNRFGLSAKLILIVSPRRYSGELNHFANLHPGTQVVESVDDGIQYIRRALNL